VGSPRTGHCARRCCPASLLPMPASKPRPTCMLPSRVASLTQGQHAIWLATLPGWQALRRRLLGQAAQGGPNGGVRSLAPRGCTTHWLPPHSNSSGIMCSVHAQRHSLKRPACSSGTVGDGKSRTTAAQQAPPQQRWRGTACTCRAWLWHHHCHGGAPFYCQQTGRQHRKRRGEGEGRGEGGSQRSAECVLSGTVRPVCTCISASPWRASVGVVPLDSP